MYGVGCRQGVGQLVRPWQIHPQGQRRAIPENFRRGAVHVTGGMEQLFFPQLDQRRVQLRCPRRKHGFHRLYGRMAYHWHARLDNARLFPSDLLDGIPQQLHVIQANGRDDAYQGRDYIGGVQASAQAHLNHHQVHLLRLKNQQRQGGAQLKGRGLNALAVQLFRRIQHLIAILFQQRVGNRRAVQAYAFVVRL